MPEIKNARIKSASLSTEDGRGLCGCLVLDYGNSEQGFGQFMLFHKSNPSVAAGFWISRCLEISECYDWSKLPGKPIRVRIGSNGLIDAIGHYLKDEWFEPKIEMKEM